VNIPSENTNKQRKSIDPKQKLQPARVIIPLSNVKIEEGQPFRLACKIDGLPKPKIVWLKNGEPLPASNRLSSDYDLHTSIASLKVADSRPDDVGRYTAMGENEVGMDNTWCEAFVVNTSNIDRTPLVDPKSFMYLERPVAHEPRVIDETTGRPARFTVHLPSQIRLAEGGQGLNVKCRLDGYPVPSLVWLKDNEPLMASNRVTTSHDVTSGDVNVHFDFVKSLDAGIYVCKAENAYGSDETFSEMQIVSEKGVDERPQTGNPGVFSLLDIPQLPSDGIEEIVRGMKPEVIVPLKNIRVVEEKPVFMDCKIIGWPKPKVKKCLAN